MASQASVTRLLILAQGLLLLGLGLLLGILTLVRQPERMAAALFEVAAALGVGALLVLASGRVATSVHWRSPVALVNLLAVPVSISLFQSDRVWIALPLGLSAVAVVLLLFSGKSLS